MKRVSRSDDGKYHIKGNTYDELIGSRAMVWHKNAYKTPGGLTRKDLLKNKHGRIVSMKKFKTAKKEKRLQKHGYLTKKGRFGAIKCVDVKRKKKTKKSKTAKKTRKTK